MIKYHTLLFVLVAGCGNVYLDTVFRANDSESGEMSIDTNEDAGIETPAGRIMEPLARGLVAVDRGTAGVYLGWRLLTADLPGATFNVYRNNVLINSEPVLSTTDFLDEAGTASSIYFVRLLVGAVETGQSETVSVLSEAYRSIPVSGNLSVHRVGIGDLDNDGEYDFVLRRPHGTILPDNTHKPSTDTFKLEGQPFQGAKKGGSL